MFSYKSSAISYVCNQLLDLFLGLVFLYQCAADFGIGFCDGFAFWGINPTLSLQSGKASKGNQKALNC
jgi:hypothetical protein